MANSDVVIRLPFKITELSEDMLVALNRNFKEIEYYLSELQTYMNKYGYSAVEGIEDLLENMLLRGDESEKPTEIMSSSGMRFYFADDSRTFYILTPKT
jgi:hypothetical protein